MYAGDIIQQGLSKVAVYKDESGKAQGFKAACPHLVCCSDCLCTWPLLLKAALTDNELAI